MSLLDTIPGVRRWRWRRRWSRLSIPPESLAELGRMFEDGNDVLSRVKRLEDMIFEASCLRAGHGINTRTAYKDASGVEKTVDIVLDGSSATESILQGYHEQIDARYYDLLEIAVKIANWTADNAAPIAREPKSPLRIRIAVAVREARRIWVELAETRKGKTSSEFLRCALLDESARKKRLAISPPVERVKLEKPPEPKNAEPKKRTQTEPDEKAERRKMAALLPEAFHEQGVEVRFAGFAAGYAVTRYALTFERGQKLTKAQNAADEVAMRLGVESVTVTKAPDKAQTLYVDVPNKRIKTLHYKDTLKEKGKLFIGIGIDGKPVFADMEELCHVLIAGTTGSGKSVFLNTLICSLIQSPPEEMRLMMVDPKQVELTPYNGIPHLTRPVITDAEKAVSALDEAVKEMERRYQAFAEIGVKKLSEYNEKAEQFQADEVPRLIIVIDELADLMMASDSEVESSIVRIAQKGRAAGLHLLIATQRPTVDVVTGMIKANIPTRIAFKVASAMESQIVLSEKGAGAEKLCKNGDMLFKPFDGNPVRLQGAYISNDEIAHIVEEAKRDD